MSTPTSGSQTGGRSPACLRALVVDVHIGNVRAKLGDDSRAPRYVRTIRGVGYRMGDGR